MVLSGGVGGAKLVDGLAAVLPAEELTVVVNTGDDFLHWGLTICPDLDTVLYTLAGLADPTRGWGLADESFRALERMKDLGEPTWFALGDRDLATHIARTAALHRGERLTDITARHAASIGVGPTVLPMCDTPSPTVLTLDTGARVPFQEWLVERRAPPVRAVEFEGDGAASSDVLDALAHAERVILAPSNPYVSIDPILSLRGVREALRRVPVVAVSPLLNGQAVKGPLAAMMPALTGTPASTLAIASHYGFLDGDGVELDGLVVEQGDAADALALPMLETDILMRDSRDRARLAREVLAFADGVTCTQRAIR